MKPKVGDMVTLKPLRVLEIDGGIIRLAGGERFTAWVAPSAIASIEPRPLNVGDRVQWQGSGEFGEIIAVHDKSAWVNWDTLRWDNSKLGTVPISHLTRIGDRP